MNDRGVMHLVLEDGSVYPGVRLGAEKEAAGEVVFNTSMTGYQEMLTDPSYGGQILVPTYPLIGNYGVNADDVESRRIQVSAFVVRDDCDDPSHPLSSGTVHDYLLKNGVPGVSGVDTRAITRKLRSRGVMMGIVTPREDPAAALEALRRAPRYGEVDVVHAVSTREAYVWDGRVRSSSGRKPSPSEGEGAGVGVRPSVPEALEGSVKARVGAAVPPLPLRERVGVRGEKLRTRQPDNGGPSRASGIALRPRIVVTDYGVKLNILRCLTKRGCEVIVVPDSASAEEVLGHRPDGVVMSPGPGDPVLLDGVVKTAKGLMGRVPVFGICLGHQVIARAFGADTFKLKFGHRGGNQPVKDLTTGRVYITAQNHGYAVDPTGLPPVVQVSHVNLNDGTVEGLRHSKLPVLTIQYHSEASPGPHDSEYLFDRFLEMVRDTLTATTKVR
jgi:carbamoyl-phosphate synthase small subunit